MIYFHTTCSLDAGIEVHDDVYGGDENLHGNQNNHCKKKSAPFGVK